MCLLLTGEGKGAVLSPLDMIFRGVEGIMGERKAERDVGGGASNRHLP